MVINTLGIDIAKRVFQLHGVDAQGSIVLQKKIGREVVLSFVANLPPCLIGMEACGGSNYWARKFQSYGHTVKLMSPQFVKPYVKTNKTDAADAEAICEAVTRPTMRFVAIKQTEQQDMQSLHRYRQRIVEQRTGLANQIRGLLTEYGIVFPQGICVLRKKLPEVLGDEGIELNALGKEIFNQLYEDLITLDEKVKKLDKRIEALCRENEDTKRLTQIGGVGALTATAMVAAIGDVSQFKNGRHLSAWIGLVPREHSSGNKRLLLGISKRGDRYLRTLLIHGARVFISFAKDRSAWLDNLIKRCGKQKAYVALANKNARVIWALLTNHTDYKAA